MSTLHLPWLEWAIALPIVGALWVYRIRDPYTARHHSLAISAVTLLLTLAAWADFASLHTFEAHDRWDLSELTFNTDFFVIDELSAPLLPLTALICFLIQLATLRTKVRRISFHLKLLIEALLLATLSVNEPWAVVVLLIAGTLPSYWKLRSRRKPTRVFAIHMSAFAAMLIAGQSLVDMGPAGGWIATVGVVLLAAGVLLRNGVVPVHCWMTDLFEHSTFGSSLLFVTPMMGAYGAMRLVLPIAPDWLLQLIAGLSMVTAVYAAGMSLIQQESRRFFTYLFLSHSSLVLVGLEIATPLGLAGALCVWFSISLSLLGFGLTLRSIESRTGRLSLSHYHGLYHRLPLLAVFFLLNGLASIGFPGTIGFIGAEMLIDGALVFSPWTATLIVLTTALNGLAVVHAYFRIFTGTVHRSNIDISSRPTERFAMLVLTILVIGGGLWPQPGVASRYHAAAGLLQVRTNNMREANSPETAMSNEPIDIADHQSAQDSSIDTPRQKVAQLP